MSRFAALLNRGPIRPQAALRLEADLARRARCQPLHHDTGAIRLWQCPPASGEKPVIHQDGPLLLAGDLALTDLSALRGALGASPETSSGDLVLAAWARWGEAALDRLNGAFAFVICDQRSGRLTAVRDRFGILPLAYALRPQSAVFAGNLSTVLAALDVTPDINSDWVADFLSGSCVDATSTAWQDVARLAPGHLLVCEAAGRSSLRAWYRLEAAAPPAAGALHDLLAQATVEACSMGPTATMLSGGLDSSSLALLSVNTQGSFQPPRPALSLRYRDPEKDEGRYIDSVLQQARGRLDPVSLPGEPADDAIFDLDRQLAWQDQPFFAPGLNRIHLLYRKARELGCTAILDGHGGDEVIGGNLHDIALLARGRGWPGALSLAVKMARFSGQSPLEGMAFLLACSGKRGFGRLGRMMLHRMRHDDAPERGLVDPELARQIRMQERQRDLSRPDPRDRRLPESVLRHARMIAGPMSAVAFETLNRAAQSESMQAHYPFYDHRVAEFCIWQPPAAKVAQGQPRALLRNAMQGVLPDMVRHRADKTNFLDGFWNALRRDQDGHLAALSSDIGPLRGWVDATTLRDDIADLAQSEDPEPEIAFRLWRAVCLGTWIERGAAAARSDLPHSPA